MEPRADIALAIFGAVAAWTALARQESGFMKWFAYSLAALCFLLGLLELIGVAAGGPR